MYDDSVQEHMSRNFVQLREDWTVGEALKAVREFRAPRHILYLYVTDAEGRLTGVLPTRALLTEPEEARVGTLSISRIVSLPDTVTMGDAAEMFVMHRLLALPIVDGDGRMCGVVDVSAFSDEVFNVAERRQQNMIFESIGMRLKPGDSPNPIRAFRLRFPWLTATLAGGVASALFVGYFEATLAASLVLAFFMTLVLGLGESVASQSLTMAVQALRDNRPTLRWFARSAVGEGAGAAMLGLACGIVAGAVVYVWHGDAMATVVVGASIWLALVFAGLIGLAVPTLLHALKLDPRVASGPLTLALADLTTLAIYFNLATWLL